MIPIIRTMISSKKFQGSAGPAPSPTVTKGSGIFMVPGDSDTGKHIISINKPGLQYIYFY